MQGRKACRDLQQILVTDLALHPANTYLQGMLERAKGNLGKCYGLKLHFNCLQELVIGSHDKSTNNTST